MRYAHDVFEQNKWLFRITYALAGVILLGIVCIVIPMFLAVFGIVLPIPGFYGRVLHHASLIISATYFYRHAGILMTTAPVHQGPVVRVLGWIALALYIFVYLGWFLGYQMAWKELHRGHHRTDAKHRGAS